MATQVSFLLVDDLEEIFLPSRRSYAEMNSTF